MEGTTLAWLLVAVALFSAIRIVAQFRGLSRKRKPVDWDEQFIQQLRKAGVNTFEEQPVDFFFTLPTRAACEQLAFVLRPDGYTLDIREDAETGILSLHAQRSMRLVIPEMQALTARFTMLAEQHGGKYDNWAVARK
jgi:Regulator of ribonuclease activity B